MTNEPIVDDTQARAAEASAGTLAKKRGGLAVTGALLVSAIVATRLVYWPFEQKVSADVETAVTLDPRLSLVIDGGASLVVSRSIGGRLSIVLEDGGARLSTRGAPLVVEAGPVVLSMRHATLAARLDAERASISFSLDDGAARVAPRGDAAFAPRALAVGEHVVVSADGLDVTP